MAGVSPKPYGMQQRPERTGSTTSIARRLPRTGRKGPTPKWPLEELSQHERELWRKLWHLPQAVAWEDMGFERTVARYCRILAEAENPGWYRRTNDDPDDPGVMVEARAITQARAEARQLEDRLGLSPKSMLQLRWLMGDEEVVGDQFPEQEDVRERLKLVKES